VPSPYRALVAGLSIAPAMITTMSLIEVPAVSGAVAVAVGFLGYRRPRRPAAQRGGTHEQHSERDDEHEKRNVA
jgi:hypothetical protein